jgi:hypothetical protein
MLDSLVLFTAAGGLDMALFLAEIAFCFPEIAFISGVVLPTAAGAWLAVNLRGRGRPLCLFRCLLLSRLRWRLASPSTDLVNIF